MSASALVALLARGCGEWRLTAVYAKGSAQFCARHECLEWAGTGHPFRRAEAGKVKICVPHRRKSGLSPESQMLRRVRMVALSCCRVFQAKRITPSVYSSDDFYHAQQISLISLHCKIAIPFLSFSCNDLFLKAF